MVWSRLGIASKILKVPRASTTLVISGSPRYGRSSVIHSPNCLASIVGRVLRQCGITLVLGPGREPANRGTLLGALGWVEALMERGHAAYMYRPNWSSNSIGVNYWRRILTGLRFGDGRVSPENHQIETSTPWIACPDSIRNSLLYYACIFHQLGERAALGITKTRCPRLSSVPVYSLLRLLLTTIAPRLHRPLRPNEALVEWDGGPAGFISSCLLRRYSCSWRVLDRNSIADVEAWRYIAGACEFWSSC